MGIMTNTKGRVLEKTREVLGLLTHHPLETKTAKELFQSMAVSVFRFSAAAQVRWSQAELDQLQSPWTRAYKRAEYLPNGTASEIFVFPKKWGGEELSTPINIIAQELCNNIRRCLMHDDVTKSITVQELQGAKEEFMCHTTHELYDEMELWEWDEVQHNRWVRALKASHRHPPASFRTTNGQNWARKIPTPSFTPQQLPPQSRRPKPPPLSSFQYSGWRINCGV